MNPKLRKAIQDLVDYYESQGKPCGPGVESDTMEVPVWRMRALYEQFTGKNARQ